MGDYLGLIAGLAYFCAGVVALVVLVSTARVSRLPLQRPGRGGISRSAIPQAEISLLDRERPRLERLGFAYRYSMVTRKIAAIAGKDRGYADVYEHPDGTHAWVERSDVPEYGEAATVNILTGFEDGTNHLTVNRYRHHIVGLPPEWEVFDDYFRDGDRAFEAHARRVRAAGKAVERDGIAMRERFMKTAPRMFAHLVGKGWIAPAREPGRWRFTWRGALRVVLAYLGGAGRAARRRPKAAAGAAAVAAPPEALERQYAVEKTLQWSKDDKRWLSAISIVAFAALGVWLWDWEFMLILLAVIGFHELGHFLAMRIVGYRNLHVFFVPGLGGLATGQKADATPIQKVFVYLAGPMPGLLVAIAAVVVFAGGDGEFPGWAVQLLIVTLAINYLNLLPVTPLDGGRVAEALLFAKVPPMRFAFAAACAAALLGSGLYTGDTVLAVIGGLVVLSLPHQWKIFRVERRLPAREAGLSEAQAKALVFEACSRPEFASWSFNDRSAVAKALVEEVQSRQPRWPETAAGLALYAACLVGPVYAVVELTEFGESVKLLAGMSLSSPLPDAQGPAPAPRDWAAEIARADGLPAAERLPLLLAAIEDGHGDPDSPEFGALPRRAWSIAKDLPVADPLRGRALLALAAVQEDGKERARLAGQVATELAQARGKDRLILADALELLSWADPAQDAAAGTDTLERAFAIRSEELPADDDRLAQTRGELARRWYIAGRHDEAGRLLGESVEALSKAPVVRRTAAESAHAGYLTARGRAADAEARLRSVIAALDAEAGKTARLAAFAGSLGHQLLWSQLAQNEPAASARARATLREIEEVPGGRHRILKRNVRHQLDRLAVGRANGDSKLEEEARQAVRNAAEKPRLPPAYLCEQVGPRGHAGNPWSRVRDEAHARFLAELGICPAKG